MAVETPGEVQNKQRHHKIPVPTNYRTASKILRRVVEERCNVKSLILEEKHLRKGKGLAMMDLILVHLNQIDELIKHTDLLSKEPRLNPWLAKVLIAELIFGRGDLNGESLPVQCIKRYKDELQQAVGELDIAPAKLLNFQEPRYVRINTNVLAQPGAIRLLQEEGWVLVDEEFEKYADFLERVKNLGESEFLVDFHFKEVLIFPNSAKNYWARATELKQKFVLQNKACVLPTYLLNPPKKSVVLDMCAAPGLKTTHLANLMKNKGRIYAVERDATRYKLLCDYAADFGVIKTINEDCLLVGDEQAPGVEYILLDPSCSGSGMVNRLKLNEEYDKQRLYRLGGLQYKLLCHAMNAFPAAKRIVYSTCSIFPEENEEIVQGALKHNGHFKLLDSKELLGKEWLNFGSPDFPGIGEKCLYARSECDLTIGMFVAVFERCAEDEYNDVYVAHEKQKQSYDKLSKMGHGNFGRGKQEKAQKRKKYSKDEQQNLVQEESNTQLDTIDEMATKEADNVEDPPKKKKKSDFDFESVEQPAEQLEVMEVNSMEGTKKKKKKSKMHQYRDEEQILVQQDMDIHSDDTQENATKVVENVDDFSKKKKKKKTSELAEEPDEQSAAMQVDEIIVSKKKKKNKAKDMLEVADPKYDEVVLAEENGLSKKKKKQKHEKADEQVFSESQTQAEMVNLEAGEETVSKKKKKNKKNRMKQEE